MTNVLRDLLRYRALVRNLVLRDLKLKYRDSVLGVLWSLLNPLLMLAVYGFAFKVVLRIQVEHFAYFLLAGLLPWIFFATSLVGATRAVVSHADLVKKVPFPRETLAVSTVLFAFLQLLLALVIFLPALAVVPDVPLRWTLVLLPGLLTLHLLFTVGLALVLAATTVFFRDVEHLTEAGLLLLFWITPIVYPIAMAPAPLRLLLKLNPAAAFAITYQTILLGNDVPDGLVALTLVGWTVAALGVGFVVFRRLSPAFAEEL